MRKTVLPRAYVLFNPFLVTIVLALSADFLLPQPVAAWVSAAVFNLAHLLYYVTLYVAWRAWKPSRA